MPVSTTITVVGLKETINALNKVEPQLVKDFKASANKIAQPAISLHRMLTPKYLYRVWRIRGHLKVDREKTSRLLSQKHAKV
jgi:hypothetical protein